MKYLKIKAFLLLGVLIFAGFSVVVNAQEAVTDEPTVVEEAVDLETDGSSEIEKEMIFEDAVQPSIIGEGYAKGKVLEIHEQKIQIHPGDVEYNPQKEDPQYKTIQNVKYEVVEGEFKGETFESLNEIEGRIFDIKFKEGDLVMLRLKMYDNGGVEGFATDYIRNNTMIIFIVIFVIAILLLGRMKGLQAIIGLIFTISGIFLVLLPLTLKGYDPLLVGILVCLGITVATVLSVAGFNLKALSAMVGTFGGVLAAVLIAYIVGKLSLLTGLSGEDARVLYVNNPSFNFLHLFFASILVGALGAVMDVGMSIASSVAEIKKAQPDADSKYLFKAGMNIGKDIMGTMTNTLILAYTGSAMPLLVLFTMNEFSFMQVMNFDFMSAEIVRAIAGSFGLLLAIPITAYMSSLKLKKA